MDLVETQSGTEFGVTLGTPIAMVTRYNDQRLHDYGNSTMDLYPRPSHADWTYLEKYGVRASSGGGRSTARETIGRVASGAIAEKYLKLACSEEISAFILSVGSVQKSAPTPADGSASVMAEGKYIGVDKMHARTLSSEEATIAWKASNDFYHSLAIRIHMANYSLVRINKELQDFTASQALPSKNTASSKQGLGGISSLLEAELQRILTDQKPYQRASMRQASGNRRKVLRIKIKQKAYLACPDSGSEKNIMSESFAKEHSFRIRRSSKDINRFELGNGKYVWSVGRVCVPVSLRNNDFGQKKRWFHVIPKCPVDLIAGMPVLKEAEILTRNRHLLEECPAEMKNISSLLWIGSPRQRMSCSLDGRDLTAIADTGSDLNFMSLECAKRGGFRIDRRREARQRIQVGDGTEAETIGQVYVENLSLDWRTAESDPSSEPRPISASDTAHLDSFPRMEGLSSTGYDEGLTSGTIFHVLPGIPCDLIFGRDLLEQTDAFNVCPDLLSPQPLLDNTPFEFNVFISLGPVSISIPLPRRKRRTPTVDPKTQHDDEKHAEMYRRSKKVEEIAAMPESQRARAMALERRAIRAYEALHTTCVYCSP